MRGLDGMDDMKDILSVIHPTKPSTATNPLVDASTVTDVPPAGDGDDG